MRILLVNTVCGIGSTGRICTELYDELVKAGHECCIAYGRGSAPAGYNNYKISNDYDNYSHIFETRMFDNHGFASRSVTHEFVKFIENYNPDIIHIHNLHGYYVNVDILFSYLNNKPIKIIWTFHDCWPFSPHSAYIDKLSNGKLPEKNSYFSEKFQYPKNLFFSKSKKNFKKKKELFSYRKDLIIVTPSNWLKNLTELSFFSENKIITINNGIDLNNFYQDDSLYLRKEFNLNNKKILLGVANIWEHRKGLDVFNYLAEEISKEFQIVLVGKIPNNKKVNKNIILIEQVKETSELRKIYSSADIFINPTLQDNYPTTNLEAIACGVPVITSNIGGTPETIQEGQGVLFSDLNDLVKKIYELDWLNKNVAVDSDRIDKRITFKKYMNIYERM